MVNDDPQAPENTTAIDYQRVEADPRFRDLRRRHRRFVFPLAAAFLLWYFAYVLLADYAHELMSTPVIGSINLGVVLGLGQFVTTFAITTWYVGYAGRRLDPVATEIRDELDARAAASTDGAAS
ncbi:DUF485 domain-containing protein [Mycetocola reblochoni]|uniref:Membrane protein n=2 Tax=Mycetocola reblochoni TaxID=331618 RepID=A0A1R4ILC4_9MICO|nr:DUF485 domain-containing protein [Mycetocola reblochoni]RLP70133.1 DUF485 domain-containing protein [Mycetocola reblochoni]SJN20529.1 membrane protein [Mycetocola reblochoni REB411]